MSEKKKIDTKALLAQSRKAKEKPQTKAFGKMVGKQKSGAKFGKVNFNG